MDYKMKPIEAKKPLIEYLSKLESEYERLRAWEFCYDAFAKVVNDAKSNPEAALSFDGYTLKKEGEAQSPEDQKKEECIDYLALHLGAFMAYWGMLRGNSFLHQTNYTIHKPIVVELLQSKYRVLYGMGVDELLTDEHSKLLSDLIGELKRIYKKERASLLKEEAQTPDLVVTKVVLGTMGCFPALDRFVIAALGQFKPRTPKASPQSSDAEKALCARRREIKAIKKVYDDIVYPALEEIRNSKEYTYSRASRYPDMKYVDMYLWELGSAIIKERDALKKAAKA